MVEPRYPGLIEHYVNLGACYDPEGLRQVGEQLKGCMTGYKACYQRAYRCLTAAAQLLEDGRVLLLTPELEARMAKRVKGMLSRECKRQGVGEGQSVQRFLGAVTWQGVRCEWGTVAAQCDRVYELSDPYHLAHPMLTGLAAGAMAAGYDVIACPDPLFPDRMAHLLIPHLSLAFVSSNDRQSWPYRAYRRIKLDTMVDQELLKRNRGRLRFAGKVTAALLEEAVDSLAQAKAMHDELEGFYNPYVDFDQGKGQGEAIIQAFLALQKAE